MIWNFWRILISCFVESFNLDISLYFHLFIWWKDRKGWSPSLNWNVYVRYMMSIYLIIGDYSYHLVMGSVFQVVTLKVCFSLCNKKNLFQGDDLRPDKQIGCCTSHFCLLVLRSVLDFYWERLWPWCLFKGWFSISTLDLFIESNSIVKKSCLKLCLWIPELGELKQKLMSSEAALHT